MTSHPPYPDESTLRAAAVAIARFACDGDRGRILGDPVFAMVTEERAAAKGYSACADLAHYMLHQLGLRDERIVNRNDDQGQTPWIVGANLSRLVFSSGRAFVWAKPTLRPQPGDILYLAPPEHVCILEHLDEAAGTLASFDYGLWNPATNKPASGRRVRSFRVRQAALWVGSRRLRGWLDLARLPGLVAA